MEKEKGVETFKEFGVILLIEDDEIVMEVGTAMVKKTGYGVLQARTGDEAIHLAQNHPGPIDLALLDMDVAGMSGEEIFPHLVTARPSLIVVVCSGESTSEGVERLLEKGAHETLQKPFTLKTLEQLLVKYVDRRHHPRIPAGEDFLAVTRSKGVYSIRIIDISKGGVSFSYGEGKTDEQALVDVAVLMAEKGVNLDDLECRIVSNKSLEGLEEDEHFKRTSVSFGKMTKQQFDKLSELLDACSGKA